MRIKVALLDDDKNYIERLSTAFLNKFSDKLEVYSFSTVESAFSGLIKNKINVFLASEAYDINVEGLPMGCGFAYLVASNGVQTLKGQKTVCRFQKAEIIFKEILGIYSENVSDSIGIKFDGDGNASVISFFSPGGGTGSTTAAIACAKRMASAGKKVMYLNIERLGNADLFLSGPGNFDLSNVIFSLKSKKSASVLKMESYVKEDSSGVYFYSSPAMALDIMDLTKDDVENLIESIKMIGNYEFIVIDCDFGFSAKVIKLFEMSQCIVFVSDGSNVSNDKFIRAYQSLEILEQQKEINILGKTTVLYNRFDNATGSVAEGLPLKSLGVVRNFHSTDANRVIDMVAQEGVFDRIINKSF